VVVYLLLAGCLFAEVGYVQVWHRLTAGLHVLAVSGRGLLVCAVDGTLMSVADSAANLTAVVKQRCNHGAGSRVGRTLPRLP
jgi:hypothetical protein